MDILTPGLTWADIEHEQRIYHATLIMVSGRTSHARMEAGERQRQLIAARSSAAVEAMERAKGLAHV